MLYILILLAAVSYFVYQGYRKGIVKLLLRVLGLAIAYTVTFLFAPGVAHWLNQSSTLNGLLGYLVAAIALFVITSVITDLLFSFIYNRLTNKGQNLSSPNRIAGAAVGSLIGVFVGLLLVWAGSTGEQILKRPVADSTATAPTVEFSAVEKWSRQFISQLVKSAMSVTTDQPELAEVTAKLMETPEVTIHHVRGLTSSEEFRDLFLDPRNQSVLNQGDVNAIAQLPAFRRLLNQPDFKALQSELYTDSNDQQPMAEKIRDMWARAQFVQNDPQTQAIINDPGLRELFNRGDVLKLLNSEKITQLFERLVSPEAVAYSQQLKAAEPSTRLTTTDESDIKSNKIYRWVDEKGQIHYSDEKPKQPADKNSEDQP